MMQFPFPTPLRFSLVLMTDGSVLRLSVQVAMFIVAAGPVSVSLSVCLRPARQQFVQK